jgi:hypothetical protein
LTIQIQLCCTTCGRPAEDRNGERVCLACQRYQEDCRCPPPRAFKVSLGDLIKAKEDFGR